MKRAKKFLAAVVALAVLLNVPGMAAYQALAQEFTPKPAPTRPANGQAVDVSGNPTVGEVEDYEITMQGGTPITTPVTLSYFQAQRKGDTVTFSWSTATETGNVGFNLYRCSQLTALRSGSTIRSSILPICLPSAIVMTGKPFMNS